MAITVFLPSVGHDLPNLDVDGASGKIHRFLWNSQAARYEAKIDSQEDADDLLRVAGRGQYYQFSVSVSDTAEPRAKPAADRKNYVGLDQDELVALAADCGIHVDRKEDKAVLIRLLDSYYLGLGLKKARAANAK